MLRTLTFLAILLWCLTPAPLLAQSSSIDEYRQQLRSEDENNRLEAIQALARMGPKARVAIADLGKCLTHADGEADAAARTLGSLGPDAVAVLLEALRSDQASTRAAGARGLGYARPRPAEARPALKKLLADKHNNVRVQAARSLWYLKVLRTESLTADYARILGEIGRAAKEAVPELRRLLKIGTAPERLAAAEALCLIQQNAETLPVLVEGLRDPQTDVRLEAVQSLQRLGPLAKSALPELRAATEECEPVVRAAARRAVR
jgi:HEAT repeat protein